MRFKNVFLNIQQKLQIIMKKSRMGLKTRI
jgi:hypothetical protein